jgi:hypothetical protein
MTRKPPAPRTPAKPPARPQGDLFRLDSPLTAEIRGERSLMAFPFFALAKNAWMKPLTYQANAISIEVRPSASGVATISMPRTMAGPWTASATAAAASAGWAA